MTDGHQIVDLPILEKMIKLDYPNYGLFVRLLDWLVVELGKSEELSCLPIQIEVIVVEYMGAYPSIGVKYLDTSIDEVEDIIALESKRIISSKSVSNLLGHLFSEDDSISS